jgi:hypothetical protein
MKSNAKDVGDFSENDLCCKFKNNLIFIWKHGFNIIIEILAFQKSEIAFHDAVTISLKFPDE